MPQERNISLVFIFSLRPKHEQLRHGLVVEIIGEGTDKRPGENASAKYILKVVGKGKESILTISPNGRKYAAGYYLRLRA